MKLNILSNKVEVPVELSGVQIKRTVGGFNVKCPRCGSKIFFDKNTIETAGPAKKLSVFQQVANGYLIATENNKLAEDVENGKIDFIEFLRRQRSLFYQQSQFPASLAGSTSLELLCSLCGGKTSVHVSIGGSIELKKLPKDVEALIKLGIHKEESKQFFQLRTGKLSSKFVDVIKTSAREIEQLKEFKKQIDNLCSKLETKATVAAREFLADVMATASTSAETKIHQLEQWQKAQMDEVYRVMFPEIRGKPAEEPKPLVKELGGKLRG
jgi:predicted nucleic-acid-binding Zn-ribbon protein